MGVAVKQKKMDSVDIKMYSSKELRKMRQMIREELVFRADVGSELENKEKGVWLRSTEWSEKVQEERKREEESERAHDYTEEIFHTHIRDRMESMRDWDRRKSGGY